MNEVKPYVYQIEFLPTGQKYVGVRYGNKIPAKEDFWNHYFTSSKVVKSLIDDYGKDAFRTTDIKEFETPEKALEYEHKCLIENDVGMNDDWLNQTSIYPLTPDVYKQIMLEKYGVESYAQTDEFKEKVKQTMLEKYGVESYTLTDEYRERVKKTNLERYGVEYPSQLDECKEKLRQTNLERYGVEYPSQLDEYKEKLRQTNLEKYGVEYSFQSQKVRENHKQTMIEKYGVENPMKHPEIQKRYKQNNLEKYGVEYTTQIKSKCLECDYTSNVTRIGTHHKKTGHKGRLILLADGSWEKKQ